MCLVKISTQAWVMGLLSLSCISELLSEDSKAAGPKLAFPGAEGFGAYAQGGRGGDVYIVTNTNDSGQGSLREGIASAKGPRTIVFAVSGIIPLDSRLVVDQDYITIAGQTAPGDGICFKNYALEIAASHVIVRHLRSRLGTDAQQVSDAISVTRGSNIIVDHCSASWSVDEALSAQSESVDLLTVQWCLVSESLTDSIHEKGPHGYGGIIGALRQSYHHNLFAHHTSRNPKVTSRRHCKVDFRNNVIYNWGFNSHYDGSDSDMNWVNNYLRYGPGTKPGVRKRIFQILSDNRYPGAGDREAKLYAAGNYVWGFPEVTANNWLGMDYGEGAGEEMTRIDQPFDFPVIEQQSALDAYEAVLAKVGAFPRDRLDQRIVEEVVEGTARYGNNGHINSPMDVGGWPEYQSNSPPLDGDLDGMSDEWERRHGLNPMDAADRNDFSLDADFTNLEVYLNKLIGPEATVESGSQAFERVAFAEAEQNAWQLAFEDPCTGDWRERWFLDGEVGKVFNSPQGMQLVAGPEFKNDAHHMVLWTKEIFDGDLKIEFEYTRTDSETRCVNILYIQATGSGEKPYLKDISEWNELRRVPSMKSYFDHMNTYHVSFAAFPNDEDTTSYIRARRYIPDATGLTGSDLEPDYFPLGLFDTGVPHRITVIKKDREIFMHVKNSEREFYGHMRNTSLPPIQDGRVGLRHMYTRSSIYKDFRIWTPRTEGKASR